MGREIDGKLRVANDRKVNKRDTPEAYLQSSHENVGNSTQKKSFLNEILRIIGLKGR